MDKRSQLCKLESLNSDVRITVLGACDSFADLAALIRASPTFFRTFIYAKTAVLLCVTGNILGPATRDAALLAKTSRFTGEDFDRQVDEAVQDYKARLSVNRPPWVTGLDAETAVALPHVTRLTQFLVDVYGYFHCRYFKHAMVPIEGDAPLPHRPRLSRTEHGRIAQAVLRRQLLVLISGGVYWESYDPPRFVRSFSPLFQTWEWQQISDIDGFLGQLLRSLAYHQLVKDPPVSWHTWHLTYSSNLEAYAQKLKSDLCSDGSLLDFLCSDDQLFRARITSFEGLWDFLKGSHRFTTPSQNDKQHSGTDGGTSDSAWECFGGQPWAWKDALGGLETCRWGFDLVNTPPPETADQQEYKQARYALESWRWSGMVFWDRERAEKLKQTSALELCQTGWLIPWQD